MDETDLHLLADPQDVLAQRGSCMHGWSLLDAEGNRRLEQAAAVALPAHTLMRRAGWLVARMAKAWLPHARQVSVLVGPGNNGGDGLEAAIHLHREGFAVSCHLVLPAGGDPDRHAWPKDAKASLQRARDAGVPMQMFDAARAMAGNPSTHLVIDALLGRGLSRAASGPLREAIGWSNRQAQAGAAVLAVDLPSGLPSETGAAPPEGAVIQANATLNLLSLAAGLFTADGRDAAGRIWFHDLGAPPPASPPAAWLASHPALVQAWPQRTHAQHKGSFGDVLVIGGAPGMNGSLHLAARAALLSGAGRVYMAGLDPENAANALAPELMTASPHALASPPQRWREATVVAGCGGGQAVATLLPEILRVSGRLVLDADALNALATDPTMQEALLARRDPGQATVLTPHPLEAARWLGCSAAEVQRDRLAAARELADRTGTVVVLKGSGTIVACPSRGVSPLESMPARTAAWIVAAGNAALGTAGSGDVLAGLIGSLWGQWARHPIDSPGASAITTARYAAATAVALHGQTAERLSPSGATLPASALVQGLQSRTPADLST